jgi:hypothetical protein
MSEANAKPTNPALAEPTGHPARPQKGQTALMAYSPEKATNQATKRTIPDMGRAAGAGSWWWSQQGSDTGDPWTNSKSITLI